MIEGAVPMPDGQGVPNRAGNVSLRTFSGIGEGATEREVSGNR